MKAQFLTRLHLKDLPGKWWQLTSPLKYYSALLDATITVPAGFVTDLAMVFQTIMAHDHEQGWELQ